MFKVNDVIRGTKTASVRFLVTTEHALMKVVSVIDDSMQVEILAHTMDKIEIGRIYYVPNDDKYFELFEENKGENIMIITREMEEKITASYNEIPKITALYNEIQKQKANKVQIGTLEMKQKIQVGKYTWSLFIKEDDKFYIMLDEAFTVNINRFGDTNNYLTSDARKITNNCNASKQALEIFSDDILIPTRLDLLSHDGLDDYGVCEGDLFGIITHDMYRINRKNIDISYMVTCTPNSTPSGYGSSGVLIVDSDGCMDYFGCKCSLAVRPFCILPSDVLVSVVY